VGARDDEYDDPWLVAGSSEVDDVRRYYDDLAGDYDSTLTSWGYDAPARVAELLLGAGTEPPGAVLDAGCGTGLSGMALRDAGFAGRLVGIDLSPDSVTLASARDVYDEVVIGDLQQPLPYEDGAFGGVVCVGVMTYVPDVRAVWGEFVRICRPGATIVCTQRADMWEARDCTAIVHEFEEAGRWAVHHLSPPAPYLPDNPDFSDAILVRYLAARVRA
jgi:SAM-dependent methyltransferase